jgi:hypothetical protein
MFNTLLILGLAASSSHVASAACSRSYTSSWPRWVWTAIEWDYIGSHGTTATDNISNAQGDWNTRVSATISIASPGNYDDIVISDDDSIAPNEGFTNYLDQSNSGCFNYWDNCHGHCLNRNAMYSTAVRLNWGGIGGISDIQSANGWTTAQTVEEIVSHEFGHLLGLIGDFTTPDCSNPSIISQVDPAS